MSESRLAHRERLRTKERFIVDTIFPAGALHVIGGPSGIGKTTWLLQSLHEWEQGKPILGFPSHPCKWVYVSLDRSLLDGDRTLRRIGLADWNIPMYSIEEICERDTVTKRITVEPDLFMVANRFEDVELIVVEGLQGFLPDIKRGQTQNKAEQLWMVKIRDEILNTGKTIIATTHSPKAEDNTKSANNRKAFLGSQALIGACSTMVSFDVPRNNKGEVIGNPDDRVVTVMPRDHKDIILNYSRGDNGSFILESQGDRNTQELIENEEDRKFKLHNYLTSVTPGIEIPSVDIRAKAKTYGLAESTAYLWINDQVTTGNLIRVRKGVYTRPTIQVVQ